MSRLQAAPMVTIGVPTYNRAVSLERAVASCRAQTYENLRILISDNASTDETQSLCRQWCAEDARVAVIRQPHNIGLDRNFEAVLHAASSEYFMWLADDDWLDAGYVASCVDGFRAVPAAGIVSGQAEYELDGRLFRDGPEALMNASSGRRVVEYFGAVFLNGTLCGLMRREHALRAVWPRTLAGDWYFVAQMLSQGALVVAEDVLVHRSIAGSSSDAVALAESYGVRGWWGLNVHLWVMRSFVPDVLRGAGCFGTLRRGERVRTALSLVIVLAARWLRLRYRRQRHIQGIVRRLRRRDSAGV